jgi:hypothetical protein
MFNENLFNRRFNPRSQGAITEATTLTERIMESLQIKRSALENNLPGPDTSDHFNGTRFEGEVISFDNAAAYDEGKSEYEDGKRITGEDGVVPCDLVGRPRDPKIGRSGKRTWYR